MTGMAGRYIGIVDKFGQMIYEGDILCLDRRNHPTKCGIEYIDPKRYWSGWNHWIVKYDHKLLQWDMPRNDDGLIEYIMEGTVDYIIIARPYSAEWFLYIRDGLRNDGLTDTQRGWR